ncbi:MAG: 4-phosphoerythronate dehydrogenase [Candidatus Kapaibacterium sp.]|nr:MAG: 4-phosphoerythronate dehydrogenase [Candidatus Kapabacteria bacterium]
MALRISSPISIFIDENIPLLAEALAPSLPSHIRIHRFHGRSICRQDVQNAHGTMLCVRSTTRVNADLLEKTPVRFVGTATSGTEHIDTEYLRASGREFYHAGGSNAHSVAEYVLFALLHWEKQTSEPLQDKTIGILGYGHIGRRVAEMAYKLGLRVAVCDPVLRSAGGEFAPYCREVSFDELCSTSEIITNHVPFVQSGAHPTVGIFDAAALKKLLPNSLFIHASRGGIVQEEALWEMVQERNIATVLDVWEQEPRIHAGLARHSLLATPHIAGYSYDGKIHGSRMIARACGEFLQKSIAPSIDADWSVFERALVHPHLPVLSLSNHATLYAALQQSRALEQDTTQLRATLNGGATTPEAAFDELRKQYPVRREISRLFCQANAGDDAYTKM